MGWVEHKQPSKWYGRVHGYEVAAAYDRIGRSWFWEVWDNHRVIAAAPGSQLHARHRGARVRRGGDSNEGSETASR